MLRKIKYETKYRCLNAYGYNWKQNFSLSICDVYWPNSDRTGNVLEYSNVPVSTSCFLEFFFFFWFHFVFDFFFFLVYGILAHGINYDRGVGSSIAEIDYPWGSGSKNFAHHPYRRATRGAIPHRCGRERGPSFDFSRVVFAFSTACRRFHRPPPPAPSPDPADFRVVTSFCFSFRVRDVPGDMSKPRHRRRSGRGSVPGRAAQRQRRVRRVQQSALSSQVSRPLFVF